MTLDDYMEMIEGSRGMEGSRRLKFLAENFPFERHMAPYYGRVNIQMDGGTLKIGKRSVLPLTTKIELPHNSRALHYSKSCFDGLLCFKKDGDIYVFRLKDHIQRLYDTATTIGLPVPSVDDMAEMVRKVIKANADHIPSITDGVVTYVRSLVASCDIGYETGPSYNAMFTVGLSPYFIPPFEMMPLSNLHVKPYPRDQILAYSSLKLGKHYLDDFSSAGIGVRSHPLYVRNGILTETDRANLAFVTYKDGKTIIYMPDSEWIVPSITKETLYDLFKEEYSIVRNRPVTLDDLTNGKIDGAEITEIFSMATAVSVIGVGKIYSSDDNKGVVIPNYNNPIWQSKGNNPITKEFYEKLIGLYKGAAPDNHRWLERIVIK